MALELPHIPFIQSMRLKEHDGVYRNKHDNSIAIFKNVRRKGYIKEDENGNGVAYDAITVNLNSEVHGKIRNCMVNMDEWQLILGL